MKEGEDIKQTDEGEQTIIPSNGRHILQALALRLWETHQKGYAAAYRSKCFSYRTFERARNMVGGKVYVWLIMTDS